AQSAASRRHTQRHLSGAARTGDGTTDDGDDAVGFSRRDAVAPQGQRQIHLSSDAVEYCAKAHPRTHGGAARYLCWTRYLILQNQFSFVRNVSHYSRNKEMYQWLPTRKELKRKRFPQKGKGGFRHPYIWEDEPVETDYPNGERGPAEHLYTDTIGASARKEEPLNMSEIKLRVKIRDHFSCQKCGHMGTRSQLQVHHKKGRTSHRMQALETLCQKCHQSITRQQTAS